jgi:hypothetical protein
MEPGAVSLEIKRLGHEANFRPVPRSAMVKLDLHSPSRLNCILHAWTILHLSYSLPTYCIRDFMEYGARDQRICNWCIVEFSRRSFWWWSHHCSGLWTPQESGPDLSTTAPAGLMAKCQHFPLLGTHVPPHSICHICAKYTHVTV